MDNLLNRCLKWLDSICPAWFFAAVLHSQVWHYLLMRGRKSTFMNFHQARLNFILGYKNDKRPFFTIYKAHIYAWPFFIIRAGQVWPLPALITDKWPQRDVLVWSRCYSPGVPLITQAPSILSMLPTTPAHPLLPPAPVSQSRVSAYFHYRNMW